MTTSGLTTQGVPAQPRFLLFIKIAILVLSLVILAIAAYSVSLFNGYAYYGTGAGGLLIFVTIKTFIIFGGITAIEFFAPRLFYRLVALIAYVISIIFWLSAWSWAASSASIWLSYSDFIYYDSSWKREGGALAACAALGAVVWILSIVHFVFFIRACMADHHGTANTTTTTHDAELGNVKHTTEPGPGPYSQTAHPHQQYPQQPYPQQQAYPAQ